MNRLCATASGLAIASAFACSPAAAATLTAKDDASAQMLVQGAHAGDVVQLQSGTYRLDLQNLKKAGEVVITPAPGANVVATVVNVDGSAFLTVRGITVNMTPKTQYGLEAQGAQNITFDGMKVRGPDCAKLSGVGAWFRGLPKGANVVLKNSKFSCLASAMGGVELSGLTIDGNDLQAIQTDGIILLGVSDIVIRNNTASNFHTAGGGHPDFIQFANYGSTPTSHVTITGNHYDRGSGDPIQGVFVEDGTDFTISGNVMQGTMYHGISVARTKGVVITNNFLQAYPDMTTWIMVREETDGATVADNASPSVVVGVPNERQPTHVKQQNNAKTQPAGHGDDKQYKAWLAKPRPAATKGPS
jgi:parallel beta-helix repeat protein